MDKLGILRGFFIHPLYVEVSVLEISPPLCFVQGVAITVPLKRAGRGRGRGNAGAKRQTKTIQLSDYQYDSALIKRYRSALDTALRISCIHNITPMPGSSIIIVNCSENLDQPCNERSMGRTRTVSLTSWLNSSMPFSVLLSNVKRRKTYLRVCLIGNSKPTKF